MASSLDIRGAVKRFGATTVLHGIDLAVQAGEFVVFVGPSGCGKSTLLRLIAGLDELSGGSIAIDGTDVSRTHPARRGVAMVFQSYALYPHMTVAGNMGFALRKAGAPRAEIAQKVQRAAEILHIETLLDRRPAELSGGQRQRVSIGRAIVREPRIFLFDEPLSDLDSELRVQMRLEIARLHRDLGTTMVFVTHDQVEAMTLADRIVVLRDGRVEQVGKPLTLYDDPANLFVAGFIGSPRMNVLEARPVGQGAGGAMLALPEFDGATVTVPLAAPLDPKGEYRLGIRPEHLERDGPVRLRATVEVVEMLGGTAFAHARGPGGAPLAVALGTARDIGPGDAVDWGFSPDRAFVFDAAGARVR